MSDHLPIIAVWRYSRKGESNSVQNNTFIYGDLKRLDEQKLLNELRNAPWDTAFIFEDTDDIVSTWYDIFNKVLNSLIPKKEKKSQKIKAA